MSLICFASVGVYFNHFAVGLKFYWQLLCQYSVYTLSTIQAGLNIISSSAVCYKSVFIYLAVYIPVMEHNDDDPLVCLPTYTYTKWFCKSPWACLYLVVNIVLCSLIVLSSFCRTPTPLINPQCTLVQSLVRPSAYAHV